MSKHSGPASGIVNEPRSGASSPHEPLTQKAAPSVANGSRSGMSSPHPPLTQNTAPGAANEPRPGVSSPDQPLTQDAAPGIANGSPLRVVVPDEPVAQNAAGGVVSEPRSGVSFPDEPVTEEYLPGSDRPVHYHLAPTWDGLYTPYALRTPSDTGRHPFVFLAYGNGGGGLGWLRARVRTHGYVMDRLLAAGYACAWGRYRSEVELGYHAGGPLVRDRRQGMDLFNRSPLEFEDEIAILEHVRRLPGIDPDRLGHLGVSHAGEMLFKLASSYPGVVTAGVACEPANHEFLGIDTELPSVRVDQETGLRDIESMELRSPDDVRPRIDEELVRQRVAPIATPMLVLGRDGDHLQGVFRVSHDVLAEAGKDVEWESWDHDLHGYVFPVRDTTGRPQVDEIQDRAITGVIEYLDRHLNP